MTFLLKDIRDHLVGSVDIHDQFGEAIYADVIPQESTSKQAIVLTIISGVPEYGLRGEVGLHVTQLQLDVYTDGDGKAYRLNELSELVRNRLNGYRGQFGEGCYGTARITGGAGTSLPPQDASSRHKLRYSMDLEIIHTAAVPTFT